MASNTFSRGRALFALGVFVVVLLIAIAIVVFSSADGILDIGPKFATTLGTWQRYVWPVIGVTFLIILIDWFFGVLSVRFVKGWNTKADVGAKAAIFAIVLVAFFIVLWFGSVMGYFLDHPFSQFGTAIARANGQFWILLGTAFAVTLAVVVIDYLTGIISVRAYPAIRKKK